MGDSTLYAKTAKKQASKMARDETLGQREGIDMGAEAIFQTLFNEAQEAVSRAYLPGSMAYIQENHGSLYQTILNTEKQLEELWLTMREGGNTVTQFKGVLRVWEDAHLKAGELYQARRKEQKTLFKQTL